MSLALRPPLGNARHARRRGRLRRASGPRHLPRRQRHGLRRRREAAGAVRHVFLGPGPDRHAHRRHALGAQDRGPGYEITPELQSLERVKDKVSVFSGFRAIRDGRPNLVHWSGHASILSGIAPAASDALRRPVVRHAHRRRDRRLDALQGARHRRVGFAPAGELLDPHRHHASRRRRPRRSRSTRACSARASRIRTATIGGPTHRSCCARACCRRSRISARR